MPNYEKFKDDIILSSLDGSSNSIVPFDAKGCPTKEVVELVGIDGVNFIVNEVKRLTKNCLEISKLGGIILDIDEPESTLFPNIFGFYSRKINRCIKAELIDVDSSAWKKERLGIIEDYRLNEYDSLFNAELFDKENVIISIIDGRNETSQTIVKKALSPLKDYLLSYSGIRREVPDVVTYLSSDI